MSKTQDEMMELLWADQHDAVLNVRRAVDGLRNSIDMDNAFYRYYEIMCNAQLLLKLIYKEISTGYWDKEDLDNDNE